MSNPIQERFQNIKSPSGMPPEMLEQIDKEQRQKDKQGQKKRSSFRRLARSDVAYRDKKGSSEHNEKMWKLMSQYLPKDPSSIEKQIVNHVEYTLARTRYNFDDYAAYQATAFSVRDRLIESWNDTQQWFTEKNVKRVYYLSLEFLMGRSLQNSILNLGLEQEYSNALMDLGHKLEDLYVQEKDAALGNGGLGRLAACFMDSMATMDFPAWGYGLRYTYGMFSQQILDGYQAEFPDYWLTFGNPWEIERLDVFYPVQFYGRVSQYTDMNGNTKFRWEGGETVFAVAYDTPIPGYDTYNTINVRLWSSKPSREFDLSSFNRGDYYKAIEDRQKSEHITSVLYPNDNTYMGKELRLKQQYFFVSATIRDIVRRFKKSRRPLTDMPEKVAIQLNDTHPSIGVAELMRILMDEEGLGWDDAWTTVTGIFAFTNHTVLPEALEKWPVDLMENLLPRHMQIIYEINWRFLQLVESHFGKDNDLLRSMSLIEEGYPKRVRMAHLGIVGSHAVNGVAALHSEIIKESIFNNFYQLWPHKFQNKTNGVTPRRWMGQANQKLTSVISKWLETDDWIKNMEGIQRLEAHANNPMLHKEIQESRLYNKQRLARYISKTTGISVDPNAMFDIHVKRIHEYKRQFLNILGVIARYNHLRSLSENERNQEVPRVVIFAGKAAPGYHQAKRVIKLINSVADVVNKDPTTNDLLKVVFIPNYNVSAAEVIIPAADLSQHISTAGTEASGTSNMKFSMNGCLLLGTLDGANVEIREEIGKDNIFIFGTRSEDVNSVREKLQSQDYTIDARLHKVIDMIRGNYFGPSEVFEPLLHTLNPKNDFYILTYDFPMYMDAQAEVDAIWKNPKKWWQMALCSIARMSKFSSDRTIGQYAKEIWGVEPCPRPDPYVESK